MDRNKVIDEISGSNHGRHLYGHIIKDVITVEDKEDRK
jgi:hypothetical protein